MPAVRPAAWVLPSRTVEYSGTVEICRDGKRFFRDGVRSGRDAPAPAREKGSLEEKTAVETLALGTSGNPAPGYDFDRQFPLSPILTRDAIRKGLWGRLLQAS